MRKITIGLLLGGALVTAVAVAEIKHSMHNDSMHNNSMHDNSMHKDHSEMMNKKGDQRQLVLYPRPVYEATLANMREHLRGIHDVQRLVGEGRYSEAAEAAERGMGMGHNHGTEGAGAEHQFMPKGMMLLGRNMHTSAANLATTLRDAEVTDELQPIFAALGEVTANCVACHDAYRLQPME